MAQASLSQQTFKEIVMKWLLVFLLPLIMGCSATGQFWELRERDHGGSVMIKTDEVRCKAIFGSCEAKSGDKEVKYQSAIRMPDIAPIGGF